MSEQAAPPDAKPAASRPAGRETSEPPPKRDPAILARSPVFAALMLVACGWLLADFWPDVAYFFSPRAPIDLGGPATFHLDRAVPNRYCRIAGKPLVSVGGVEVRSRNARTVVALQGTDLVVDRAANAGPVTIYEGRLLPDSKSGDYPKFVALLQERLRPELRLSSSVPILRDGERPGSLWSSPALALLVLAVALVNMRALLRKLLS